MKLKLQLNIKEAEMKKELANKSEIKLVGLTARTNNKNEMNPQISKIGELAGRFWSQNMANQIPNRKNPGVTLSVYTEYDSNQQSQKCLNYLMTKMSITLSVLILILLSVS